MPRPSIGETAMTGAERQARWRAARETGEPVIRIRGRQTAVAGSVSSSSGIWLFAPHDGNG
jgi:hypothetical protein